MILIKSAFWMVIMVILCCYLCACTSDVSQQGNNHSGTGTGVIDKTPRDVPKPVLLADALEQLAWYNSTGIIDTTNISIHQIHGSDVDRDGRALTWVLGVSRDNESLILVYSSEDWEESTWSGDFQDKPLKLDALLFPEQILLKYQSEIKEKMTSVGDETLNIDISDDQYTITIGIGSNLSYFIVNAETGEIVLPPR